jgi:hypothetical protein
MKRARVLSVTLGWALLLAACRDDAGDEVRTALQERVARPAPSEAARAAKSEQASDTLSRIQPGALPTVAAAPVVNWTGPGDRPFEVEIRTANPSSANSRRFGTITLRNSARVRTPDLGQYPCASCHQGRRMILRDERITDAHQNLQPVHPAQTGATCSTCHAAENVELLALKSGERATLDHAYRLCAQCHYKQAESWAGGAHGKRLDGWQGRRVVMGCADCHDPHNPAIEPRVPFRAPQLQRPTSRRP